MYACTHDYWFHVCIKLCSGLVNGLKLVQFWTLNKVGWVWPSPPPLSPNTLFSYDSKLCVDHEICTVSSNWDQASYDCWVFLQVVFASFQICWEGNAPNLLRCVWKTSTWTGSVQKGVYLVMIYKEYSNKELVTGVSGTCLFLLRVFVIYIDKWIWL